MFFAKILDGKIIDCGDKCDWSGWLGEKSGRVLGWYVAVLGYVIDVMLIG